MARVPAAVREATIVRNVAATSREHDVLDVADAAAVAEDPTQGLRIGEQVPGADVEQ